jgi:hypothetical protein
MWLNGFGNLESAGKIRRVESGEDRVLESRGAHRVRVLKRAFHEGK